MVLVLLTLLAAQGTNAITFSGLFPFGLGQTNSLRLPRGNDGSLLANIVPPIPFGGRSAHIIEVSNDQHHFFNNSGIFCNILIENSGK